MSDEDDLPDSSPSADERRGADDRRRAVDRGTDPLAEILAAAMSPRDLSDDVHEQILARVLGAEVGDGSVAPEPEATPPEIRAAEELRRVLDAPAAEREGHHLGALASALRAANDPRPIDQIRNEALLRPALRSTGRASARVLYAAAAGVLAIAASMTFYLSPSRDAGPAQQKASLEALPAGMVEARSTAPLFTAEDFPQGGGKTSDRADRIAGARSADLRNNRYVAWGVE